MRGRGGVRIRSGVDALINPVQDTGALWPVLRELALPWGEPVADRTVLSLTHEVRVALDRREEGRLALAFDMFYASEWFFELLSGGGDSTEEEFDDPYGVIERRYEYACELHRRWQLEALPALGPPSLMGGDPAYRMTWTLPRMDVSLEVTQEDKETPVEVHLILTPPGFRPPWWD